MCVGNSFRSVLSEELFNARAPDGWVADSAGVSPEPQVAPAVEWLLREKGIRMRKRFPRLAAPEMIERASWVVTFGCLDRCPIGTESKFEDWPLPGSTDETPEELRAIRDDLSRRIDALVSRLVGAPMSKSGA